MDGWIKDGLLFYSGRWSSSHRLASEVATARWNLVVVVVKMRWLGEDKPRNIMHKRLAAWVPWFWVADVCR